MLCYCLFSSYYLITWGMTNKRMNVYSHKVLKAFISSLFARVCGWLVPLHVTTRNSLNAGRTYFSLCNLSWCHCSHIPDSVTRCPCSYCNKCTAVSKQWLCNTRPVWCDIVSMWSKKSWPNGQNGGWKPETPKFSMQFFHRLSVVSFHVNFSLCNIRIVIVTCLLVEVLWGRVS